VRVFVPLSIIGALVMVSQGAVQNLTGFRTATTLAGGTQKIPGGLVASMEAIKLLGTNGGSYYGTGGTHPFENPTGFTNMFDPPFVIVLPFAIIFVTHTVVSMQAELHGNHLLPASVSQVASGVSPGLHGLTEVTYAFASVANNNGSAFAGLAANTTWYDTTLGLAMLIGRFAPIVLSLAIAGSLAGARVHARTRATLDTSGPTFAAFLLGVIVIVGGLIYFPMLILGPIGERIIG
jgi:K+-transporting ATPase A subunit